MVVFQNMIFTLKNENKTCNNCTFIETWPSIVKCVRVRERERRNHRKCENFHACIGEIPDFACVVGKLARRTVHLLQFSKVTVWPLHYIVRATVCECNIFKTCASCAGVACSEEWLGSLLQPTEEIYTSWLCLLEKNFSYRLLIPFFFHQLCCNFNLESLH